MKYFIDDIFDHESSEGYYDEGSLFMNGGGVAFMDDRYSQMVCNVYVCLHKMLTWK